MGLFICASGRTPDVAEHAIEVGAKNFFNHGGRLAALLEFPRDGLDVLGAGEIGNIRITIFAGSADAEFFAAGDVLIEGFFLFVAKANRIDRTVGADADVVGAADVEGMKKMSDDVFARGNGGRSDEVGHEIDAEVSAAIGERLEDVVGLIARVGIHRGTSGMSDEYGLRRRRDGVGGGAVPAVAHVDGDAEGVHLLHGIEAGLAESGIAGFKASVAKGTTQVVSELHDANPQTAKGFDTMRIIFEELGVLKSWKDADLPVALGARNIGMPTYEDEQVGIALEQRVNSGEGFDGAFKGAIGDGEVDGGDTGLAYLTEGVVGGREGVGGEGSAKSVDYQGISVERCEVVGEGGRILGEQSRREDSEGSGLSGKNEEAATIHAGHYSRALKKQPSLRGRVEIRVLRKRLVMQL